MENFSFAFVLAGFVVGLIVGLTGVGGGSLMTPLLIFGFGIKPALAVGTDLLFAAGTKFGGLLNFARQRIIPWRVVFSLSLGSVPAAVVTLALLHHFGTSNPSVQHAITFTLGIALLLTAAATLYKAIRGPLRQQSADIDEHRLAADIATHAWMPVVFGAVIGVLVTLTSVGVAMPARKSTTMKAGMARAGSAMNVAFRMPRAVTLSFRRGKPRSRPVK